jgi:hypothetical protein
VIVSLNLALDRFLSLPFSPPGLCCERQWDRERKTTFSRLIADWHMAKNLQSDGQESAARHKFGQMYFGCLHQDPGEGELFLA